MGLLVASSSPVRRAVLLVVYKNRETEVTAALAVVVKQKVYLAQPNPPSWSILDLQAMEQAKQRLWSVLLHPDTCWSPSWVELFLFSHPLFPCPPPACETLSPLGPGDVSPVASTVQSSYPASLSFLAAGAGMVWLICLALHAPPRPEGQAGAKGKRRRNTPSMGWLAGWAGL